MNSHVISAPSAEKDCLGGIMQTRFPLRCREDGDFRMLCVSDFHLDGERTERDPYLKRGLTALVRHTCPDLVMIAGDVTDGEKGLGSDGALYEALADTMEVCEENGIPWAHVPGNHDREEGIPTAVFQRFPHCLSVRGDPRLPGYGTYLLPVYDENDLPVFCIWAFDSHTNLGRQKADCGLGDPVDLLHMPFGFDRYSGVYASQAAWYWDVSEALEQRYGHKIPGVMVMHMPLPEHTLIPSNPTETEMRGEFGEFCGCASLNAGLFAAAYERGDIREIVSGHDHFNSFSGTYLGITLSQDASIGREGYGRDTVRGGRVIDFHKGGSVTSRHAYLKDLPEKEEVVSQ